MRHYARLALLIIAAGLALTGCQKKVLVKGVELEVKFGASTLSDNLITDVEYKWKMGSDFQPLGRDYSIFVHFWHNSNLILQDDYIPDVPTSKWEKGKEYSVKRRVYIPAFIDEFDPQFKGDEPLRLSVGFYNPYDRSGGSEREVLSKKLKVVPPPIGTPEVIYESGWYDKETNPESPLKEWRWTAKEAKCVIDNPRRDALLVIKGGVNLDLAKDQKVIFKINDTVLDEFQEPSGLFEKSYQIKKGQLGDKDEFTLTVAVDKAWVPAKTVPNSKDTRELGLQISFIYFR